MRIGHNLKLGVNIDHIATLRQARRDIDPDPLAAARVARRAGADMIVCHLREDRRHIQDQDLFELCKLKGEVHLELAAVARIVEIALKAKPDSVCLVPERRQELTTEGGLKLVGASAKPLRQAVSKLKAAGIEVSLFIDPEAGAVRAAKALGADTVELCTSAYSRAKGKKNTGTELERLELAGYLAYEMGMGLHAGHGLDYHNVKDVAAIPHLTAVNIGFSIVSRALFVGLKAAVAEMKELVS
ncbi:MAG: pyridoxine 5'-phosphate synthase [Elusimicrobia bacterium]|nr:pyridoxine 5'-phosphate synthase [Elusimicrobiota bacterium]MDE2237454.1 pyridoxine 5'-phosphate synthase [Elusimicrobiota bacterium]MDE2425087.1 pyridoxine 5'-phosphate synthase [Elusimicrobiota bacterium]